MEELFGLVGFHLEKTKSYGNGKVTGSVYKIVRCKIVDIYSGDKEDIDVDIFVSLFNNDKILSSDSRLRNLANTEIGINDNPNSTRFTCNGSVYKDPFYCNLCLNNQIIVRAPVINVSLAKVNENNFNVHIAYDLSSDNNVIYITGNFGFNFRYRYLDRHLERVGYLVISSVHRKILGLPNLDLSKFFDCFELTDNKVLYINNSCEITELTYGDVIIKNGCKDLYLGSFLYPELKRLVLPPSIENAISSVNSYGRLDENIDGIELYLSTATPDSLKIEICKHMFGKCENLDEGLSFDETYGEYENVHLY